MASQRLQYCKGIPGDGAQGHGWVRRNYNIAKEYPVVEHRGMNGFGIIKSGVILIAESHHFYVAYSFIMSGYAGC